jgi:2-C-methyl-D-erythritol 4-phosphate cytidylyltransferase/2-C-methyl-D-erythritol 2,4-cyclodiphosphate synthase
VIAPSGPPEAAGRPDRAVVVVAAGSGTRLGQARAKAFVEIGGLTVLEHALSQVYRAATPTQVIVVVPSADREEASAVCASAAGDALDRTVVVVGGDSRQASVAAGLAALDPAVETVLVHDAARAFTPAGRFDLVAEAVEQSASGIVPGLPVTDTIKQRREDGLVVGTLDRSSLVAVQTPQGFPRARLVAAYAAATTEHTDDAALYAAAGHDVRVVEGDPLAFKITTPADLRHAESLVGAQGDAPSPSAPGLPASEPDARASAAPSILDLRTGVGTDVHAFDPSAPLWLGGLLWPGETGLAGHSDGDALSHAICDALLSATGLGDVGLRFGTSDDRYAGAHGDVFLTETLALVTEAGYRVVNVAVQVVALRPRLSPRRAELEAHLGGLLGAPVSVAGTTTDGLGFTGTGEGVAVVATALVYRGT